LIFQDEDVFLYQRGLLATSLAPDPLSIC